MRKNFGQKTYFFPLPVLVVGTYNEDNTVNAMNVAWGGICDYNMVEINLSKHKTTDNIALRKAFTVSFADSKHVIEADYVGIVSGNDVPNKVEKAGLHIIKSEFVDAPIIEEFPVTLECELIEMTEDYRVIGKIINVSANEEVLNDKGEIDSTKLNIITYNPVDHTYIELGKTVGHAFKDGLKLK